MSFGERCTMLALAWALAAPLDGCRPKGPEPAPARERQSERSPSPAKSASEPAPSASQVPDPPPLPEGCFAEAPLDATPEKLLGAIVEDCQLGPHELGTETGAVRLTAEARLSLPFELSSPACVRWVAAGSQTLRDIQMKVLDASQTVLAQDELFGNLAIVGIHGPICLEAGSYALQLDALDGSGRALVRGFSSVARSDAKPPR